MFIAFECQSGKVNTIKAEVILWLGVCASPYLPPYDSYLSCWISSTHTSSVDTSQLITSFQTDAVASRTPTQPGLSTRDGTGRRSGKRDQSRISEGAWHCRNAGTEQSLGLPHVSGPLNALQDRRPDVGIHWAGDALRWISFTREHSGQRCPLTSSNALKAGSVACKHASIKERPRSFIKLLAVNRQNLSCRN